jgi:cobalt/nickel transport system permease protein
MVHISDGVLSLPVLAAGWAITIALMTAAICWSKRRRTSAEEIPKLSVVTAAFFVASLIHISVGPTSVHLILSGLVGVILGILAYPAIFIGLVLQFFLFQHGGITTIGINTVVMGVPALISYGIFKAGNKLGFSRKGVSEGIFGAIAGGLAVALAVLFLVICLLTTGKGFSGVASLVAVAHIPIIIIEAAVVGSVVAFLVKVKPELIPLGGAKK